MRRHRIQRGSRKKEEGIIIVLVAVFMLFVVGAMAALAIDVTSFYTARSEAQLVADGAALAGARVLANSGMTSNSALAASAASLCSTIATQVANSNQVGGTTPTVTVTCNPTGSQNNPTVTVRVTTSLPTFFARIWGRTSVSTTASATAEVYNPSGLGGSGGEDPPVAPLCVKPWLLPNVDPTGSSASTIFNGTTGAITNTALIGASWPGAANPNGLFSQAYPFSGTPALGQYYPVTVGAGADELPVPTQYPSTQFPSCSSLITNYQLAIAGCVPTPLSCGANVNLDIDTGFYANRDSDTVQAAECLIHYNNAAGDSDSISGAPTSTPPFQFVGGNQNPVSSAVGKNLLVSDSLVTIPVYQSSYGPPSPPSAPTSPVTVIGFLQVFLNPQSAVLPYVGTQSNYELPATIVNIVGCGTDVTGTTVYGNGPSAVPVRLITPQ